MSRVVDAHALIWHLTSDKKLGEIARRHLELTDQGETISIIPTIVLAELMYTLEKKGELSKFNDILTKFLDSPAYVIYPLDYYILEQLPNFTLLEDIHDRIIVATAYISNCPLLSNDKKIRDSGYVDVFW